MKRILALFLSTALVGVAYAQTEYAPPPTDDTGYVVDDSASLLGKRHVILGFGFYDADSTSPDFFELSAALNVPVAPNFDAGAFYAHGWDDDNSDIDADTLGGYGTYYWEFDELRPFVSGSLARVWPPSNDGYWAVAVTGGAEYLISDTLSVRGGLRITEALEDGVDDTWALLGGIAWWFDPEMALVGSLALIEDDDVFAGAGVLFTF